MAYSTRSLELGTVTNSLSYWAGVRISSIIWPSWSSPIIPRVLVLERTLLRLPTSLATVCISPRPLLTDSNCLETVSKEVWRRLCKVFSNFSSTVWRICSNRKSLEAWICCIRSSVLSRFLVKFSASSARKAVVCWCISVRNSIRRSLIAISICWPVICWACRSLSNR